MKWLQSIAVFYLALLSHNAQASHVVGGEIYYDHLGGTTYDVTVKIYRDCESSSGFDDELPLTLYNPSGIELAQYYIDFPGFTTLPVEFSNPCVTVPTDICVEEAVYNQTFTFPASPSGYVLSYQKCCRTEATINLNDPGSTGFTLTCEIPATSTAATNSSSRYNNLPPLMLCTNDELEYDFSVTDPDGDDITYSLCDPIVGGGTTLLPPGCPTCPSPVPAMPPPYASVDWLAGLSATDPFGGGGISIDPVTGVFTAQPDFPGYYAYAVCATESRGGTVLNVNRRDFIVRAVNCDVTLAATITPQPSMSTFESYCDGLTIDFENTSYGGDVYSWDFGVPGISSDVSDEFTPTYTFPSPGIYEVMLVVNPGWPCTDTSIQTFNVNNDINADFLTPEPQCIIDNSFDFEGGGIYPTTDMTFGWNFGAAATPSTAATEDVSGIAYSSGGYHTVTYSINYNDICFEDHVDSVFVFGEPEIDFYLDEGLKCAPYLAQFINESSADSPMNFLWNFGDGSPESTDANPEHLYNEVGTYDITFTIWTTSGCIDTLTVFYEDLIVVHPSPTAGFNVSPDEASVFDPYFYFEDESSEAIGVTYIFTDGYTSTEPNVWHPYVESGYHYPYQVAINEFGCTDTAYGQAYVTPLTTIFVPNAFSPNGDGINDVWQPNVFDTYNYEIWVFDRWGQHVMNSTDETAGWDGRTPSGEEAPAGVYTYRIKYMDGQTELQGEYIGHFTLLR